MVELPADYEDAIEAFLIMPADDFKQIGIDLEELADAYCEAAEIRNGNWKNEGH